MELLADAGLTAYRFGIEWARIEPLPGRFSRAELAHYRRMIDTALGLGLTPVVTLNHFTTRSGSPTREDGSARGRSNGSPPMSPRPPRSWTASPGS
ncbi:putative beta-glucosidase 17 [Arthrobacter sp. Hiyo8]|nr:putative beta-glucosidase 17 [Arthrobacter sp. Hiyo8]